MPAPGPKHYYQHVHLMRGFTIAWIVATHTTSLAFIVSEVAGNRYPIAGEIQSVLFYNSTVFFALISGLLYSLVLARKPIVEFYRGKARNVLAPYLVMSLLYVTLNLGSGEGVQLPNDLAEFTQRYAVQVLAGTSTSVMWYIPVILILFLLTPFFAAALRSKMGIAFLVASLSLPFFFSREWPQFSFNNVAYFAAPYVFGMWLGSNYDVRSSHLARWMWAVGAVALLTSIWMIGGVADLMPKVPWEWRTQLYYVQKMCFAILLILAFRRLENIHSRLLERLGEDAFALYFLHPLPIFLYGTWAFSRNVPLSLGEVVVHAGVLFIVSMALCLAIIALIRRVAGSRSRLLIGS